MLWVLFVVRDCSLFTQMDDKVCIWIVYFCLFVFKLWVVIFGKLDECVAEIKLLVINI